ncbi:hybrid sensor histidine kinase/response regulator transcription factor [Pedobacter sp. WC2501]|uniref:hybrid sensor histidine kinase/response regulator transcription factor n=1 Tax=Pedobacter sp. WC2501 TaxID=3461400 RepID=UPI0040458549
MMRFIKAFVFIMQFWLFFNSVNAQVVDQTAIPEHYVLKTYGINDGLPSKNTTVALKDKRGFVWIGTENGLCKFDGYSFKVYVNIAGDSTSLTNNYINAIVEDSNGFFWVGTMNGLNRFDPVTEKFERFYHKENDRTSLSNNKVWSLLIDKTNKLWVGTDDGFNLYNKNSKTFKVYQPDAKNQYAIKGKSVNAIAEDAAGNLWLGNWSAGLNKFDQKTKRFTNYMQKEIANQKNPNDIWTLCLDHDGMIWIGCYWKGDLFRFDPKSEKFTAYPGVGTGNSSIFNVLSLGAEKLLVGGSAGIFWVNTKLNKWEKIDKLEFFANGGLYRDKSGMIWLCGKNGLTKIDFNQYKFNFISLPFGQAEIRSIISDRGNFWLGTSKGLYKYNPNNRAITKFLHTGNPNSLSSNDIINLSVDLKGQLWVMSENGFDRYSEKENNFVHHHHRSALGSFFNEDVFRDLIEVNDGEYYLATDAGLKIYNDKIKAYTHYYNDPKNLGSLSNNHLYCLLKDAQGNIWIGTYGSGLSRFNPKTKKFSNYMINNSKTGGISNNIVNSLYLDSHQNVWICTRDGLNKYVAKTNTFEIYSKQNGFATNVFTDLVEDNNGRLWVTTEQGISLFDPVNKTVKNYDEKDGVYANAAICKNAKGEIFLAGSKGIVYFNPQQLKYNKAAPAVYFSDFSVFNKLILPGKDSPLKLPVYMTKSVTLPYDQSVLSFGFVALNYTLSEKNQYAYFLEGFDKKWNYSGSEHKVTYTNLNPGKYTLRVRASNNDGVWNRRGNSIQIIITPPWYRTWWAFCFYGLAFFGVVYAYLKYREHQSNLKFQIKLAHVESEKEKELSEKKLSFFTNVSHEFRTPLTLIINPVKELLYKNDNNVDTTDLNIVYRNAKRLLSLVDQLLLFRKADTYGEKLKVAPINLVSLCKEVFLCFIHQARSKNVILEFSGTDEVIAFYADREKIEIVFFNLLSNAIKFTPEGGKVRMIVDNSKENVIISIEDSGCGITDVAGEKLYEKFYQDPGNKSAKGGFGIGLYLAKNFIEMHGGTINYTSIENKGTTFNIALLRGMSHFKDAIILQEELVDTDSSLFKELIEDEISANKVVEAAEEPIVDNQLAIELKSMLIIDDNIEIREYLKQVFRMDYHLYEASNGEKGYEMTKELLPDIVICDVMMDGITGIELCSKIKEDVSISHIPIILLTAISAPEVKLKGIEGGADDYISKPFDKDFLKARVASILKSKNALQKYFYNEITLNSNNTKISAEYKEFLDNCIRIVEEHLTDPDFNIDILSAVLGMSRSNLYRKIKSISGQSANGFIRFIRLRKAAEIFINTDKTIQETSYMVGINDPKYFREQFSKLFNMNPSQYIKKFRKPFSNHIQLNSTGKKGKS